MYIDKMSKKEKIEHLKSKIQGASEELLDAMLLDFEYEYSDEYFDEYEEE